MRVLHVGSECAPFAKTGGLADVLSALPRSLARLGVRSLVVMPRYRQVDPEHHMLARRLRPMVVPLGDQTVEVTLYEGTLSGGQVPVVLVDHALFDRDGIYGEAGAEYPDNGLRFGLLARAALEIAHRMDAWPDIVHAHDWQAGFAPLYAKKGAVAGRPIPATVTTIHNIVFQGHQPKALVDTLGLGWDTFVPEGIEWFDQINMLKAGLAFADCITTVSPRYAREIQGPELGANLDGFLRARAGRLVGILNGIDTEIWSPDRDPHLPAHYDRSDLSGKTTCKARLQRELGLPVRAQTPLIGCVSRLAEQKGIDMIVGAGEELARMDLQMAFLGSGERRFEDALANLARRYPSKVTVALGFDDPRAHRIEAGADLFLMPSRYEPCGLNQMYSLRYGTIPIVRATGGLDDTVVDFDERTRTGTGFKFAEPNPAALVGCVKRAVATYRHREAFETLMDRAMALDYGWEASARRYLEVYQRLVPRAAGHVAA